MPTFQTPEPIAVELDIIVGDVQVAAGDREDTVVEVRPSDPDRQIDVAAAELTRVEFASGTLTVRSTKRWRSYSPFNHGGSVDIEIALPTGSRVTGRATMATFRTAGTLGDVSIKTFGDIPVEGAAEAQLATSGGDITLERASGPAELSTATGEIRAGRIGGSLVIKNSNGDSHVGQAEGDLRINAANGDIDIGSAAGSVTAKTGNGNIVIGAVRTGSVVAESGNGSVEIAVADGVAAWLDLHTGFGRMNNELEASGAPAAEQQHVEVRASSGLGDITIRRAH